MAKNKSPRKHYRPKPCYVPLWTEKDKSNIKAVVTVRKNAENLPELYDAAGQEVLVVCSGNAVYDKNVDMVQSEDDQRSFEFGAEYDEDRTLDDEREAGIVDVEPRRIEGSKK